MTKKLEAWDVWRTPLARHIGLFWVTPDLIAHHSDLVVELLKGLLVVRCELLFNPAGFRYEALSTQFEAVQDGCTPPVYTLSRRVRRFQSSCRRFSRTELLGLYFDKTPGYVHEEVLAVLPMSPQEEAQCLDEYKRDLARQLAPMEGDVT